MPFLFLISISYLIQLIIFLASTDREGVGHRALYPACIFYTAMITANLHEIDFGLALSAGMVAGATRYAIGSLRLFFSYLVEYMSKGWWGLFILEIIVAGILSVGYYNQIVNTLNR